MESNVNSTPDFKSLFESAPGLFLVLLPDAPKFTIAAVSDAYAKQTMTKREQILNRGLFEVFPDDPEDPKATGVQMLSASLGRVILNHAPDTMAVQKYAIQKPAIQGGGFEERYWSPINSPVFDVNGKISYIIHHIEDVTEFVRLQQSKSNSESVQLQRLLNRNGSKFPFLHQIKTALRKLVWKMTAPSTSKIESRIRKIIPIILVAAALTAQLTLRSWITGKTFLLLYPTVFIGAMIGGFWPGIIAASMATLGAWYFFLPIVNSFVFESEDAIFGIIIFYASGILFSTVSQLLRSSRASEMENFTNLERVSAQVLSANQKESALRHEIERVLLANTVVSEAIAAMSETGLHIALKAIALQAQSLAGAEYAALGIVAGPDKPFDPWVTIGMSEEQAAKIGRIPRPVGMLGIAPREGVVVRTKDIHNHPNFKGLPAHHPNMTSLLSVPIFYRDKSVGNIYLANKRGAKEFSADDERRIQMLAARTGAAIETARLYDSETLQKNWLQSIFDQMPDGIIIVDEHGEILQQNLVAKALSRDSGRLNIWGNPLTMDIRDSTGAPLPIEQFPIHKALTLGEATAGAEVLVLAPDGELVPILISAVPIKTSKGEMGAVSVFQDIRTLKELERLREEWSSIIAHDLRQPLSAIGMRAQLIQRLHSEKMPEKGKKALSHIREDVERLNRMIGDLLDLSRIEAKQMSLDKKVVNVGALTKKIANELQGLFTEHTVHVEFGQNLLSNLDTDRFQQVLGNLLSNAAKYGTPNSEIRVEVLENNGKIEVIVSNIGSGIPADQLSILFSRFARTRESRAGHVAGLGLGLYITKGLVEAHGGKIWAESIPGETTSFHFTLPISTEPEVTVELPERSDSEEKEESVPLEGIHVLIVDDAKEMLCLLHAFLENAGAIVSEAESVTEAMTMVAKKTPGVMITDLEMPNGDGYELIKKIHSLANKKHIPMAVLTAHSGEKEIRKISNAGFDDRLVKPVSAEKLISSVRKMHSRNLLH